jgi:hypothetical protein
MPSPLTRRGLLQHGATGSLAASDDKFVQPEEDSLLGSDNMQIPVGARSAFTALAIRSRPGVS